MSRLFLSHSSADNAHAIALAQWLRDNGWSDFFLDLDPKRGIAAGDRWLQAFMQALGRCEAVVFLLSPAWTQSRYCRSELDAAKGHGKRLFGVIVKPVELQSVAELAAEWQLCDLTVAAANSDPIKFAGADTSTGAAVVSFSRGGLDRLARGLRRAGLDPHTFAWPPRHDPKRSPYPGLRALDREDAAVFFGRDTAIVRSLDKIRLSCERRSEHLFVILGASGAGKSSFLRAGLLPRLERDVDHFVVLPTTRPASAVMSGSLGLLGALKQALADAGEPTSLAQVRESTNRRGLVGLIEKIARPSTKVTPDDVDVPAQRSPRRTVILPIDQAEELFAPDGKKEFELLLDLVSGLRKHVLGRPPHESPGFILLLTIRSDALPLLQACAPLQALVPVLDSLEPMAATEYKSVIEGPARRHSEDVFPLTIEPQLADKLVDDAQGADALPLLAMTLEWLYREFEGGQLGPGRSGIAIGLAAYEGLGGVRGVIGSAVARALENPTREPAIPSDAAVLDAALRRIFPLLATVDPTSGKAQRLVADRKDIDQLPHAAALAQRLIDQRLLVEDRRAIGERADIGVVEVAHEALLRQWDRFERWLADVQASLMAIEVVRRAAADWQRGGRDDALLVHGTSRLRQAETLERDERLGRRFSLEDNAYLAACRAREQRQIEEREAQQQELGKQQRAVAEEQRQRAYAQERTARTQQRLKAVLGVFALAVLVFAGWTVNQTREVWWQTSFVLAGASDAAADDGEFAQALRLAALASDPGVAAWLRPHHPTAIVAMVRATVGMTSQVPVVHEAEVLAAAFSPDGRRVVTASHGNAWIWDTESGKPLVDAMRHEGWVNAAQFSPDGRRVVTASEDKTARVWEAESGKALSEAMRHEGAINTAYFSPDGQRLVTASKDKTARIWDAESGKALGEAMRHEGWINTARFSPDGRRVVTASSDRTARIWDAESGKPLGAALRHGGQVLTAQFSPDGRRVVTASDFSATAQIWDAASGMPLGEAMRHEGWVFSAQFSPDGRRVVTASSDKTARIWDAESGKPMGATMRHEGWVNAVQFSPDSRRVVTGSADGAARIWEADSGEPLSNALRHQGPVGAAQFSHDGERVVTASADGTARIWDVRAGKPLGEALLYGGLVRAAQFSPDGRRVVTASSDWTARIWDAETGKPLGGPLRHLGEVFTARFSPDGRRVVTASEDKTARVWDAESGEPVGEALRHDGGLSTWFSPDGRRVITASSDKTARIWDAESGRPLGETMRHESWVNTAQFSPDGRRVVTASEDKTARIWDAESGKPLGESLRHEGQVRAAQFSPDGRRVVTASDDMTARVWDAESGKPLGEALRHEGNVFDAQFSPDGRRVVTASADKTARIWDAESGKPLGGALRHKALVTTAQFSADGRRVVTASEDNTARIWDADSGMPLGDPLWHEGWVATVQFSPDGRRLVTASGRPPARIWDASLSATSSRDELLDLACSRMPSHLRIVSASDAARAKVIDPKEIGERDVCHDVIR